jgi:Tfp pilus assembly protein PilF
MQDDRNAETSYREVPRGDPRLVNSHLGLAKIYQRQQKYAPALGEINAAIKLDPARPDIHYVRGQVLLHLGRKEEAQKELKAALSTGNERRAAQKQPVETGTVPSPEQLQDPQ